MSLEEAQQYIEKNCEQLIKDILTSPPKKDRCVRECPYMHIEMYGHGMGECYCRLDGYVTTGTCRHMRLWSEWKK